MSKKILPIPVKITDVNWSREEVYNDYTSMYLYSENLMYTSGKYNIVLEDNVNPFLSSKLKGNKYPTVTQACIRGLSNAYPIITKPDCYPDSLFDIDSDSWEKFTKEVDFNISLILEDFHAKGYKHLVIPSNGFASGKSKLPLAFAKYLCNRLNNLIQNNKEGLSVVFTPRFVRYIPRNNNKLYLNKKWYSVEPNLNWISNK